MPLQKIQKAIMILFAFFLGHIHFLVVSSLLIGRSGAYLTMGALILIEIAILYFNRKRLQEYLMLLVAYNLIFFASSFMYFNARKVMGGMSSFLVALLFFVGLSVCAIIAQRNSKGKSAETIIAEEKWAMEGRKLFFKLGLGIIIVVAALALLINLLSR